MEIFGDLERLLSEDLYPYRWPLAAGTVVILAAVGWLAWRRGWTARAGEWARRRPLIAGASAVLILAVVAPSIWILASPLWTRTTLVEESPLALAAVSTASADTPMAVAAASSPTPAMTATMTAGSTPETTSTPDADLPRVVRTGTWEGADEFHFAEGRALIIETAPDSYTLRVEEFSIRNGPDLFVYASPDPAGYTEAAVKLGALKATDGAFNYELPPGLTPEEIGSIVVWCDAFAVLFATAGLN